MDEDDKKDTEKVKVNKSVDDSIGRIEVSKEEDLKRVDGTIRQGHEIEENQLKERVKTQEENGDKQVGETLEVTEFNEQQKMMGPTTVTGAGDTTVQGGRGSLWN